MTEEPAIRKIPLPWQKRAFDLVFSSLLLLLSSPVFCLVLAGIFLENLLRGQPGRSAYYVETRISQGEPFAFRKFNTFKPGVVGGRKDQGQFIHTKDLERAPGNMSMMGRILKQTYLDELPQILSILSGDMTVVGPRPRNLEIYYGRLGLGEGFRTALKAGLTGMVQAHKDMPGLNMAKQAELDQWYMDFWLSHSPWRLLALDLGLMARTGLIMAKAQGL